MGKHGYIVCSKCGPKSWVYVNKERSHCQFCSTPFEQWPTVAEAAGQPKNGKRRGLAAPRQAARTSFADAPWKAAGPAPAGELAILSSLGPGLRARLAIPEETYAEVLKLAAEPPAPAPLGLRAQLAKASQAVSAAAKQVDRASQAKAKVLSLAQELADKLAQLPVQFKECELEHDRSLAALKAAQASHAAALAALGGDVPDKPPATAAPPSAPEADLGPSVAALLSLLAEPGSLHDPLSALAAAREQVARLHMRLQVPPKTAQPQPPAEGAVPPMPPPVAAAAAEAGPSAVPPVLAQASPHGSGASSGTASGSAAQPEEAIVQENVPMLPALGESGGGQKAKREGAVATLQDEPSGEGEGADKKPPKMQKTADFAELEAIVRKAAELNEEVKSLAKQG